MARGPKNDKKEKKKSAGGPHQAPAAEAHEEPRHKQRVLVLCSRGIVHKHRHLMNDLVKLLPHCSKDSKLDTKERLSDINEICEMKNCNNALFFEARKHTDLYLWMSKTPNGPSAKFHVENIHTMAELNFTGNHMIGSRPFLVFDQGFETTPHLQLLKEMFSQVFGTPKNHRRSKPFHDHILGFFLLDGRIWVRNYQMAQKELDRQKQTVLIEVGPRFVLNISKIFSGSFAGSVLYSNPSYVSPNELRAQEKRKSAVKYISRKESEKAAKERMKTLPIHVEDPLQEIFASAEQ